MRSIREKWLWRLSGPAFFLCCLTLSKLHFTFSLLTISLALFAIGFLFWMASKAVRFPFQLEFTEGTTAYGAHRVAHREPLYTDFSAPPLVTFGYPPVFYTLTGTVARWAQLPVLQIGRLLSLISGIGISLLIFWLGGHTLLSFFSATAFLLNPFLLQELLLCEPNTMALFFGLLALAAALKGKRNMIFLFATLSFFTKPLFLSLPLTALCLVRQKDGKLDILPVGLFFFVQLALFLYLVMQTKGAVWDHLLFAHRQPFRLSQIFYFLTLQLRFLLPLLVLLLFVKGVSPYSRTLLLFSLIPILLSAKEGASPIYFGEALIGLHLLFARPQVSVPSLRIVAFLSFFVLFSLFFSRTANIVYSFSQLTHSIMASKSSLITTVRSFKYKVLTEDADLSFLAGKPWLYEPFNTRSLFLSGRQSPFPLQKMLKERKIRLVIASQRLVSDPFVKPYLGKSLVPIGRLRNFTIFLDRSHEKD